MPLCPPRLTGSGFDRLSITGEAIRVYLCFLRPCSGQVSAAQSPTPFKKEELFRLRKALAGQGEIYKPSASFSRSLLEATIFSRILMAAFNSSTIISLASGK